MDNDYGIVMHGNVQLTILQQPYVDGAYNDEWYTPLACDGTAHYHVYWRMFLTTREQMRLLSEDYTEENDYVDWKNPRVVVCGECNCDKEVSE